MLIVWDRHRILAAIKRKGETMSSLEKKFDLPANTLSVALCRPFPKGEKVISTFLGVPRDKLFKFHANMQKSIQQKDGNRLATPNDSQKRQSTRNTGDVG